MLPGLLVLLRHYAPDPLVPLEKVEEELKVNASIGIKKGLLHSDDVYFYGSPNVMPREEKLIPLLRLAKQVLRPSRLESRRHRLAHDQAEAPREMREVLLDEKQSWWGVEVGVETGSPG